MFEALVAQILNRKLGAYVEGLDSQNLSVAVWAGDVQLQNLSLRRDALRALKLPIDVKAGSIGRLTVKIPWSQLLRQSVIIQIDDLDLLAGPSLSNNFDMEAEEQREQAEKYKALAKLEIDEELQNSEVQNSSSFLDIIVENLQVVINNVHVRYEDTLCHAGHPFAVGFTLKKLEIKSTDANWAETYVQEIASVVHKTIKLSEFGVYWAPDCDLLGPLLIGPASSPANVRARLSDPEFLQNQPYLLSPVTGMAKFVLNRMAVDEETPRFQIDVKLESINVEVNVNQYHDILCLANFLEQKENQRLKQSSIYTSVRTWRPRERPRDHETCLQWWKYAFQSTRRVSLNKNDRLFICPSYITARREDRKAYIRLWIRNLTHVETDLNVKADLDALESRLSIGDIRFFRNWADLEIESKNLSETVQLVKKRRAEAKTTAGTWYGWWFGGSKTAEGSPNVSSVLPENSDDEEDSITLTPEQKEYLFRVVTSAAPKAKPETYVKSSLTFSLGSASVKLLHLKNSELTPLCELKVNSLSSAVETRPTNDGMKIQLQIEEVRLADLMTPNPIFHHLIAPREILQHTPSRASLESSSSSSSMPGSRGRLLDVVFERSPLRSQSDFLLNLTIRPVEIVLHPLVVQAIVEFFTPPDNIYRPQSHHDLQFRSPELEVPIHKRIPSFGIQFDVSAPQILIPQSARTSEINGGLLAIDFGHLTVESESYYEDSEELLASDSYTINLSDVQVIACRITENWRGILRSPGSSPHHVVDRFTIETTVIRNLNRTLIPGANDPPALDFRFRLPKLSFRLTEQKLFWVVKCLSQIANVPFSRMFLNFSPPAQTSTRLDVVLFRVKFTINEIELSIVSNKLPGKKASELPLIFMQIHSAQCEVTGREFDFLLRFSLSSVQVLDYQQSPSSPYRLLLSTENPQGSSFVELEFVNFSSISKTQQETYGRYHGLDTLSMKFPIDSPFTDPVLKDSVAPNLVHVYFNTLNLNLKRKSLATLIHFFTVAVPPEMNAHKASPTNIEVSTTRKFKFTTGIARLNVNLIQDSSKLLSLALTNANLRIDTLQTIALLSGTLGSVEVVDHSSIGAMYPKILSSLGEKTLSFYGQYHLLAPDAQHPSPCPSFYQDSGNCDLSKQIASALLVLESVKYCHSQRFLKVLMNWVDGLQELNNILMRKSASTSVTPPSAFDLTQRIRFRALISNAVLMVPRNTFSDQYMEAEVNKLVIQNNCSILESSAIPVERITAELKDFSLFSAKRVFPAPSLADSSLPDDVSVGSSFSSTPPDSDSSPSKSILDKFIDVRREIVRNCGAVMSYVQSLEPSNFLEPDISITGSLSGVNLTVCHHQYDLLLGILRENFASEADVLVASNPGSLVRDNSALNESNFRFVPLNHANETTYMSVLDNFEDDVDEALDGDSVKESPPSHIASQKHVSFHFSLEIANVSIQLFLDPNESPASNSDLGIPFACLDLKKSLIAFKVFKDDLLRSQGYNISIICQNINAHDTRQTDEPNYFSTILSPVSTSTNDPQLEIDFHSSPDFDKVQIILNRCRMIVLPDWLLTVKDFFLTKRQNLYDCVGLTLNRQIENINKPYTWLDLGVSITNPEFIVLQDLSNRDTNAVVLKFIAILKMNFWREVPDEEPVYFRRSIIDIHDLEVFSCKLDKQQLTALSIIDPFKIEIEYKAESSELHGTPYDKTDIKIDLKSNQYVYGRFSYQDLRLFLALLEKISFESYFQSQIQLIPELREEGSEYRRNKIDFLRLRAMSFLPENCLDALSRTQGFVELAAVVLFLQQVEQRSQETSSVDPRSISLSSPPLRAASPQEPIHVLKMAGGVITLFDQRLILQRRLELLQQELEKLRSQEEEAPEIEPIMGRIKEDIDSVVLNIQKIDALPQPSSPTYQDSSPGSPSMDRRLSTVESKLTYQSLEKLVSLGFAEHDCLVSLRATGGNEEEATTWLFENAPRLLQGTITTARPYQINQFSKNSTSVIATLNNSEKPLEQFKLLGKSVRDGRKLGILVVKDDAKSEDGGRLSKSQINLNEFGLENKKESISLLLQAQCVAICIIDDCQGRDVPLIELKLTSPELKVSKEPSSFKDGFEILFNSSLSGEFYNTKLSTWESFIEEWVFCLRLRLLELKSFSLTSEHRLDFNLSPVLLSSVMNTLSTWYSDYQRPLSARVPFLPYRLVNVCGVPLNFSRLRGRDVLGQSFQVLDRESKEFDFAVGDEREKLRHGGTHNHVVQKICLQLSGYKLVKPPIPVDRVGTFVLTVQHETDPRISARLVVSISVFEGRKLIEVRSGLLIRNTMTVPLEVRVETGHGNTKDLQVIESGAVCSVPINLTSGVLRARPFGWGYYWSDYAIDWTQFIDVPVGQFKGIQLICSAIGDMELGNYVSQSSSQFKRFYCCARIVKEPFFHGRDQPSHTITFLAPLTIRNLLPMKFDFSLISGNQLKGDLWSGDSLSLYDVDMHGEVRLELKVPGFERMPSAALINPTSPAIPVDRRLMIRDFERRILYLDILNERLPGSGGSRTISIFAPYWMVNRSELPLLFRQAHRTQVIAGVDTKNIEELCRPVPRMFSCDEEGLSSSNLCQVRVGNTNWSGEVSMDVVGRIGSFCVPYGREDEPPEYELGVEITTAPGVFSNTKVLTFVPRFVMANSTSHTLRVRQFIEGMDHAMRKKDLEIERLCKVPYHWPRYDLPRLLCLEYVEKDGGTGWSSPFEISVGTVHVKLSSPRNKQEFLLIKVEVRLLGAAFEIVYTESDASPPFRIDNRSYVPLLFRQDGTTTDQEAPPASIVPFAWSELTGTKSLVVCVKDSPRYREARFDLERIYDGPVIEYERFFYIVGANSLVVGCLANMNHDVMPAVLCEKIPHHPCQLWTLNKHGNLTNKAGFLLEADALPSGQVVVQFRRMSRNKDVIYNLPRQLWKFENERLISLMSDAPPNMMIRRGARLSLDYHAVVDDRAMPSAGQPLYVLPLDRNSSSQFFHRQHFPPGSGTLFTRVIADGSTRVLVVLDSADKDKQHQSLETDWLGVKFDLADEQFARNSSHMSLPALSFGIDGLVPLSPDKKYISLDAKFPAGIGVSFVDNTPQEIAYFWTRGVECGYTETSLSKDLRVVIHHAQLDNQMTMSPVYPVVLLPEPHDHGTPATYPTFFLEANRSKDTHGDAEVFTLFELELLPLCIKLEELWLLKMIRFAQSSLQVHAQPPSFFAPSSANEKRVHHNPDSLATLLAHPLDKPLTSKLNQDSVYFEKLQLSKVIIRISYMSALDLDSELEQLKKDVGLGIAFSFENASLNLDVFILERPFASRAILLDMIQKHYKQEVLFQAYRILGAVDLLGNPLGVIQHVYEGMKGFYKHAARGNVLGGTLTFASSVVTGFADSISRFTNSLSNTVGKVALDRAFLEQRQRDKLKARTSSSDHLKSGVKRFAHGMFDGIAGVVAQPIKGATEDGAPGAIRGLMQGVLGVFAKPVVAVLDLTAETTAAMRNLSGNEVVLHLRCRLPRSIGPDRILRPYDVVAAEGRKLLLYLNKDDLDEQFVGVTRINRDQSVLVTSERLVIIETQPRGKFPTVISECWYLGLDRFEVISEPTMNQSTQLFYLRLVVNSEMLNKVNDQLGFRNEYCTKISALSSLHQGDFKPIKLRCDTQLIAVALLNSIQAAFNLYLERRHLLASLA